MCAKVLHGSKEQKIQMSLKLKIEKSVVLTVIVMVFVSSLTTRCARQSAPIGGPKDTIPPIIKKMTPYNYSTNFKEKEIVFEFNEFMQVKDASKEVMYSPPMNARPQLSLKGKSIVTKFPSELVLEPNTTYRIDYGNALRDNNEGNPAQQISFVFSTGDEIDSLSMSGLVINALTGDTVRNALVFMYDDFADTTTVDSTLFTGKVQAMFRTDSLGVFFASNLKPKNYRVYAVEDNDNSYSYTVGKDNVGFYETALNPALLEPFKVWFDPVSRKVHATPQSTIRLFNENREVNQNILEITRPQKYRMQATFNAYNPVIDTVIIDGIPFENILIDKNRNADTVSFWIRKNGIVVPDTLIGSIGYLGKDSVGNPQFVYKKFSLTFFDPNAPDKKKEAKVDKKGKVKVGFFQRIKQWFQFRKRKEARRAAKLRLETPDSLLPKTDSLSILKFRADSLRTDSLRLDSISKLNIASDSLKNLKIYINPTGSYNPNDLITINTDYPIDSINYEKISLHRLSSKKRGEDYFDEGAAAKGINTDIERIKESFKFVKDSTKANFLRIEAPWKADSEYEFQLDPSAMVDIVGDRNDSIVHKFKTVESRKLTTINIHVSGVDNGCYIAELVEIKGGRIAKTTIINRDSTYAMSLLPVQEYRLRFIEDSDCNGKMSTGSLVRRVLPEQIGFYTNERKSTVIQTKENFEININVDLKTIFSPLKKSTSDE